MKLPILLSISLIALAGAQHAGAQEGKTRAQVRAELDQAIHAGELLAPGELGVPLRQLRPDLYATPMVDGKSRQQVKDELAEAIRTGDIVSGESSISLNALQPSAYPPVVQLAGKTRQQVKAELAEAIRIGDVDAGGESGLTRYQLSPARYSDARSMAAGELPAPIARRAKWSWAF